MISVVIPLYNKVQCIARTISSVLAQSFPYFEVIVVDDGSTDGSAQVVEQFDDKRIRIIYQANAGVASARNTGVRHARNEWVALLDGDDIWREEYLRIEWELHLKYPDCDVCGCAYLTHEYSSRRISPIKINRLPFAGDDGVLTNYFEVASVSNPPICSSAVMIRRSALLSIGGFPIGVTNGEDLMTWAKLAINHKIAYSRRAEVIYMLKEGYGINSKPQNIPTGNVVGDELESLIRCAKWQKKDLKRYISFWYKIRANLFLRGGERFCAIINSMRVIRYNPLDIKGYIYLFLCFMPSFVVSYAFRTYNNKLSRQ